MDCTSLSTAGRFHTSPMIESFAQRVYPEYNYRIPVIRRANGSIEFGDHPLDFKPTPASLDWFRSLDGTLCCEQAGKIAAELLGISQSHVADLLSHGFTSGAITDARNKPRTTRWLNAMSRDRMDTDVACVQKHVIDYANDSFIDDPAHIIDRRSITLIELVGQGPLLTHIYQLGLDSGFQFTRNRSFASIVIFVSNAHPHVFQHENSHTCVTPHLHVGVRLDTAQIGPLVIPGKSSCFRCAQLHRRDHSPDWMGVDLQWRRHVNSGQSDSILTYQTAAYTLLILRHWIDGIAVTNTSWTANLPWLHFQAGSAPPHPLCGCQLHQSDVVG